MQSKNFYTDHGCCWPGSRKNCLVLEQWFLKVSVRSRVTPRYLGVAQCSNLVPFHQIWSFQKVTCAATPPSMTWRAFMGEVWQKWLLYVTAKFGCEDGRLLCKVVKLCHNCAWKAFLEVLDLASRLSSGCYYTRALGSPDVVKSHFWAKVKTSYLYQRLIYSTS